MDNILTNDLLALQYKVSEIIIHIEKYQDKHKELISSTVVKPQLLAINNLLNALIEAMGFYDKY